MPSAVRLRGAKPAGQPKQRGKKCGSCSCAGDSPVHGSTPAGNEWIEARRPLGSPQWRWAACRREEALGKKRRRKRGGANVEEEGKLHPEAPLSLLSAQSPKRENYSSRFEKRAADPPGDPFGACLALGSPRHRTFFHRQVLECGSFGRFGSHASRRRNTSQRGKNSMPPLRRPLSRLLKKTSVASVGSVSVVQVSNLHFNCPRKLETCATANHASARTPQFFNSLEEPTGALWLAHSAATSDVHRMPSALAPPHVGKTKLETSCSLP